MEKQSRERARGADADAASLAAGQLAPRVALRNVFQTLQPRRKLQSRLEAPGHRARGLRQNQVPGQGHLRVARRCRGRLDLSKEEFEKFSQDVTDATKQVRATTNKLQTPLLMSPPTNRISTKRSYLPFFPNHSFCLLEPRRPRNPFRTGRR